MRLFLILTLSWALLSSCANIERNSIAQLHAPAHFSVTPLETAKDTEYISLPSKGARKHAGQIIVRTDECEPTVVSIAVTDNSGYVTHWDMSPQADLFKPYTLSLEYLGLQDEKLNYALSIGETRLNFFTYLPISDVKSSSKNLEFSQIRSEK